MVVPRRYGLASCRLQKNPTCWYAGSRTRADLPTGQGLAVGLAFGHGGNWPGLGPHPPRPAPACKSQTDDLTRLIVFRNVATPTLIENNDNAKMVAASFILGGQGPRANGRDKISQSISPLGSPVIGSAFDPYQVLASALLSSPALVPFIFPMMGQSTNHRAGDGPKYSNIGVGGTLALRRCLS